MSKFFLTSIFISIIMSVSGDPSFGDGDAGQPGEFLRYGVGARALGMGRAFTAVADDASAMYWNPGGMIALSDEGHNVMLMATELYGKTVFGYFGAAFALDKLKPEVEEGWLREAHRWYVGPGLVWLCSGGFEERDEYNVSIGEEFSDNQWAGMLTLTRLLSLKGHHFGLGLNAKCILHELLGEWGWGLGLDVGLKYLPDFGWFGLGLVAQNINQPNIQIGGGGDDKIPLTGRAGLFILPKSGYAYVDALLLAVDYEVITPSGRKGKVYVGAEYDLLRVLDAVPVKIRFGFSSGSENLALGIQLNLPNQSFTSTAYNNWLPRADWATSSHTESALEPLLLRGSLDYSWGANTDKKYYERGLAPFAERTGNLGKRLFERALTAKKLDPTGNYQIAARLRLSDVEVLSSEDKIEDKIKGLSSAVEFYAKANDSKQVKGGKREIDRALNRFSHLFYIQGLIVEERYDEALSVCQAKRIWDNHKPEKDEYLQYLEGYIWYKKGEVDTAVVDTAVAILSELEDYALAKYVLGRIYLKQGKYEQAKSPLSDLILKGGVIPEYIYGPYFEDDCMADDAQLLMGTAYVGLRDHKNALRAFAKVPRFYPDMDAGRLVRRQLGEMLAHYDGKWDATWTEEDWVGLKKIVGALRREYEELMK